MLIRVLDYGPAAGGKSYFGTSSFWDSKKREYVKKADGTDMSGLWITIGAEDNPTLHVPEINRKRFASPTLDDLRWLNDFERLAMGLVAAFKKEKKPAVDAVFFDGFSEFDLLYQQVLQTVDSEEIAKNKFHVWGNMMAKFFRVVQLLQPVNTGAHFIASARRGEVRKFVQRQIGTGQDKKTWEVDEGEWFGADAAPSLHGGFKRDIPHYFDYVLYTDTGTKLATEGPRKGQKIPVHELSVMKGGDVYVKNNSEEQWLASSYPLVLENSTFPQFLEIVEKLNE